MKSLDKGLLKICCQLLQLLHISNQALTSSLSAADDVAVAE
jgi:hypothetical protein